MSSSPILIGLSVSADQRDPAHWIELGRAAEDAGIGLLLIDEPRAGRTGGPRARLDAALIASLLAARTATLGLVPAFGVTHREPFHISKAIATIDHVSAWHGPGRAGWLVDVDTSPAEAAAGGRRAAPDLEDAWAEAAEVADVVQRLWDSWEDDAEIRDLATGRFIDRDKLHHIDFAGDHFSIRGPSITPRPPQGQPVTFVRRQPGSDPVHDFADVIIVQPGQGIRSDRTRADQPVLTEIDVTPGGDLTEVLAVIHAGADGVLIRTDAPLATLEVLSDILAELRAAGRLVLGADSPQTLRGRLGLNRPTNRYALPEAHA